MKYLKMLDHPSELGLTDVQKVGVNEPLPDMNSHISINMLEDRIKILSVTFFSKIQNYKELKILNKVLEAKKSAKKELK